MGNIEELKILQKIFDMTVYGYKELQQFPKSVKFTLVEHIQKIMDEILDGVIEAEKKYYKKTTLQELDVNIMKLKMYLRLSMTLGYLPLRHYEMWSEKVVEIGKMLGGWIKSVKQ